MHTIIKLISILLLVGVLSSCSKSNHQAPMVAQDEIAGEPLEPDEAKSLFEVLTRNGAVLIEGKLSITGLNVYIEPASGRETGFVHFTDSNGGYVSFEGVWYDDPHNPPYGQKGADAQYLANFSNAGSGSYGQTLNIDCTKTGEKIDCTKYVVPPRK